MHAGSVLCAPRLVWAVVPLCPGLAGPLPLDATGGTSQAAVQPGLCTFGVMAWDMLLAIPPADLLPGA